MRLVSREGCRDVRLELPKSGEQIVFESGDAPGITQRTEIRVRRAEVQPHDFGMVTVYGWALDSSGFPGTTEKPYRLPIATLDARRVHRR
jgi:hypothetical protein